MDTTAKYPSGVSSHNVRRQMLSPTSAIRRLRAYCQPYLRRPRQRYRSTPTVAATPLARRGPGQSRKLGRSRGSPSCNDFSVLTDIEDLRHAVWDKMRHRDLRYAAGSVGSCAWTSRMRRPSGLRPQTMRLRRSPPQPRVAWRDAAAKAKDSLVRWRHLERAHIVSQPDPWLHNCNHAAMLVLAVRQHDRREALGQVLRQIVAAPGSMTGRYPVGNTGRATAGLMTSMPVPDDLAAVLTRR